MRILQLNEPFPQVIEKKKSYAQSIHASTIVSGANEAERETLRLWFARTIATTTHFCLEKPEIDERQANAPREFRSYVDGIKNLGLTVWDIQHVKRSTISVVLKDSNGNERELSGHCDFLIAGNTAKCVLSAYEYAECIVEIQSKDDPTPCEYQIVTYMVLAMNRFALKRLAGILVYNNGTCRAYRASRSVDEGAVYEQNDTFDLYQIVDILPKLLDFR